MARWYIESREAETWRNVSDLFADWVQKNHVPKNFGWSEGDSVTVGEKLLLCFAFPDDHGEKIGLFEVWARTTGRQFGEARKGKIYFPNEPNLVVSLPIKQPTTPPPWLR